MTVDIVEASIAELSDALREGAVTSVGLVAAHLNRIAAYDWAGPRLNGVPVLNPDAFREARASDERRARGEAKGPLDGIPYTVKASYSVAGLPVTAGSPAFRELVATRDAAAVERLRAAGAVLLGLTTMSPMANGGMQRGLYGRAESPYNGEWLTSAFGSGSSNGSGTATAASLCVFGLAEETWSSGRAPASNNGLVAYTPSRGVISIRGNWPLVPTMDVVVPHTRTVDDLLLVLDAVVGDDPDTRGDFWRRQPWVELPDASALVPKGGFASLAEEPVATAEELPLAGVRLGVPRLYLNEDAETTHPVVTRDSVVELWRSARARLEAAGAEVVEVGFPALQSYEKDRPGAQSPVERGLWPEGFAEHELWELSIFGWDDFLQANGQPGLDRLAQIDGALLTPPASGALPDRYGEYDFDISQYVPCAARGVVPLERIPDLEGGVHGLEEERRLDVEDWLDELGLAALVFPAVADIGPADADVVEESAALAWRNGTWVANGNLVPRHLGIPTVTVPMGLLSDIRMPVGLTFAGRAYDDVALLRLARAFEGLTRARIAPPRTPPLPWSPASPPAARLARGVNGEQEPILHLALAPTPEGVVVTGSLLGGAPGAALSEVCLFLDDHELAASVTGASFTVTVPFRAAAEYPAYSEWLPPHGQLITAVVTTEAGTQLGAFAELPLPPG